MPMKKLHEGGVWHIIPDNIFNDARGTFLETHRVHDLAKDVLHNLRFVQGNLSRSNPFTLRGMHYQHGPCGKLIRCVVGDICQVSVDVRKGSLTFGEWTRVHLDAKKHEAVYVPPGFANGFVAMQYGATVVYEMTDYYDPKKERTLKWDDPEVGIGWPMGHGSSLNISKKDREAPRLRDIDPWRAVL